MALDFHRLDNNQYLFALDNSKYNQLEDIFETYRHRTGISIDPYGRHSANDGKPKSFNQNH